MISRERRAGMRKELDAPLPITGSHSTTIALDDIRALLDYADERDQACLMRDENRRLLHDAWERAEKAENERDRYRD